jgi:tRNA threonylcarbamoyladenosine biosynthesis protein TsaB
MNILAIESSCGKASVALYSNKSIIAFRQDNAVNMQAENIFPLIDEVFDVTGLKYEHIKYLVTTTGPGSFTGIRIGLSAIKGIALAAAHLSPVAFSNFEVLAFRALKQVCSKLENIVVIFEASSDTLYVQSFNYNLNAYHEPEVLNISDIEYYLKDYKGLTAIAGSGIKLVRNTLPAHEGIITLPRFMEIDAKLLISLAAYKLRFGKPVSNSIEPLYIKPPSVTVKA